MLSFKGTEENDFLSCCARFVQIFQQVCITVCQQTGYNQSVFRNHLIRTDSFSLHATTQQDLLVPISFHLPWNLAKLSFNE